MRKQIKPGNSSRQLNNRGSLPLYPEKSMELQFGLFDIQIEKINKSFAVPTTLAVAKGYSIYDRSKDRTFKDVFARADQHMYEDKNRFYNEKSAPLAE